MSQNLYHEAIAEARQLREMAEQNAKNKIIDAVSPKIKQIIEKQLLEVDHEVDADAEDLPPEEGVDAAVLDLDGMMPPMAEPAGDSSAAANISIDPTGEINLNVGGVEIEIEASGSGDEDEDLMLNQEVAEALARIVGTNGKSPKRVSRRLKILEARVKKLSSVIEDIQESGTRSQKMAAAKIFETLLREAVTLRRQVILTEQDTNKNVLTRRTNSIIKEMNQMSRRSNNDIFDFLFEGEVTEEPAAEEVDVDAASTALEDLGTALGLEVSVDEEGGEEEEDEGAGELDLGEMDEMEEMEETYEIDESVLRRALQDMRSRRLNEEGDPVDTDPHARDDDGEVVGHLEVEVDEDDLLNALADELGPVSEPEVPGTTAPGAGDVVPESRRRSRRSQRIAETRRTNRTRISEARKNRALQGQLVEYKKAVGALKGQLTEMNLFNAKLLYANKLMQNRNLTPKQQRAIVEALDNAKTLREAKLLYKSLTSSLRKRGSSLNENRSLRTLGSASKSARSAQPITEGAGSVDRWAVLAGIGND